METDDMLDYNEYLRDSEIERLTALIHLEEDPDQLASLLWTRGTRSDQMNRYKSALPDFLQALDLAPNREFRGRLMLEIAYLYLKLPDNREKAMWWAARTRDYSPEDADAHFLFGMNCEFSEFYSIAVEEYQLVLKLNPDHDQCKLRLGVSLRWNAQFEESARMLEDYVCKFPDNPEGLYNLAWTLDLMSVKESSHGLRAIEYYEKALSFEPRAYRKVKIERKLKSLKEKYPDE